MIRFLKIPVLVNGAWFLLMVSCSTDNGLRKFDEVNIKKEIPADVAMKFEVKDMSQLDEKKPGPTSTDGIVKKEKKTTLKSAKNGSLLPPNRRAEKMPFEIGEKLNYDIRFLGMTAATFSTEVLPPKLVNDRKVYHLLGKAKTVTLFELVYRVDDLIESFWDFDGLYSHRFTMNLDESKQSRKLIELYDYEKRKSFFWNRIDHSEKGFSETKEQFDIKLWSQDPLSFLYFIRVVSLPKNPGDSVRLPVILDGKPWEAVLTFERKDTVPVGSKYFPANVYKLENYHNGELKNKDNLMWISDDEQRYLLRMEAKVKVGSFAIALDQIL